MARQFEIFRPAGNVLVVVIQSDLLEAMQTRVVAPLLPAGAAGQPMSGLNPSLVVDGQSFVLMPQLAATLTLAELGRPVGSLAAARDSIVRAVDILLSGV
jgi:toxin CcdB